MQNTETSAERAPASLIDPFARAISYLRVSVTDRCDLRCVYCMAEHMTFLPKKELLTLEELDRLCSIFVSLGVKKLRITGGEPLVRRDVMTFFSSIARHLRTGELEELTLTTNGTLLRKYAGQLAEIGIKRINVSLDTLDAAKFAEVTRWGRLAQVLDGLDAAAEAGLKVKINCVALKGFNDGEVHQLVEWCGLRGYDLTFIEVMPMGEIGEDARLDQYWSVKDLRAELDTRWRLEDIPFRSGGPARYVLNQDTGMKIGFITPLTHNFCESCNRVRLTCTGELYMCLGQEDRADLRAALRDGSSNEEVVSAIRDAIARKPKGHDFDYSRRQIAGQMPRHMSHTGG